MIGDAPLDAALSAIRSGASIIHICTEAPADYDEALAFSLGYKSFGAGNCFTAPSAGVPDGRKIESVPITDGVVTASGEVSFWAAVDDTTLFAAGPLLSNFHVDGNDIFTMPTFTIRIPTG